MSQLENYKENQQNPQTFQSSYIISEILNKSQRNEVYLAKNRYSKEYIVIKVSKKPIEHFKESSQTKKSSSLTAIESEFNLLNSLKHKNIVQPNQLGHLTSKNNRYQYITYPFADFGCLIDFFSKESIKCSSQSNLQVILNHPLKYNICRKFFNNILDAVDNCFKNGICHRDIKLDNILVNRNYELILADFDLSSKYLDDNGQKKTFKDVVGSHKYFAPELWNILQKNSRCQEYDGEKADIFSLGVFLFGLVCGKMPFENSKKTDSYYSLLYKECPGLFWEKHDCQHITIEVKSLIESMLSYYPQKRPSIKQLKDNQWINGKILSSSEIKEIFG